MTSPHLAWAWIGLAGGLEGCLLSFGFLGLGVVGFVFFYWVRFCFGLFFFQGLGFCYGQGRGGGRRSDSVGFALKR